MWGSAKGFNLKLFHEQVGNERPNGEPMEASKVVMCGMDMFVLLSNVGSCCNFCWTICTEGSTGAEVKRILTS